MFLDMHSTLFPLHNNDLQQNGETSDCAVLRKQAISTRRNIRQIRLNILHVCYLGCHLYL